MSLGMDGIGTCKIPQFETLRDTCIVNGILDDYSDEHITIRHLLTLTGISISSIMLK